MLVLWAWRPESQRRVWSQQLSEWRCSGEVGDEGEWGQFSTSNNIYLLFKMFYKVCDWWSFLRKEIAWKRNTKRRYMGKDARRTSRKIRNYLPRAPVWVWVCLPLGFPGGSVGKESTCNAGDLGDMSSIPGWGRSPGGGHGNPLQYSCLENPMDRGAWWAGAHGVAKSQTWLLDLPGCLILYPLSISWRSQGPELGLEGWSPEGMLFLATCGLWELLVNRGGWTWASLHSLPFHPLLLMLRAPLTSFCSLVAVQLPHPFILHHRPCQHITWICSPGGALFSKSCLLLNEALGLILNISIMRAETN